MLQSSSSDFSAGDAAAAGVGIVVGIIYLIVIVLCLVGMWKIFEKAGKPGWASIVPIYNIIVMLEIVGLPIWAIVFAFIPCLNLAFIIVLLVGIGKSFGKDVGYIIGMILLGFIFIPMLGFSSATYQGPALAKR